MNNKLDRNDLESNYDFHCDLRERQQHILNILDLETREEQENYMADFGIEFK